VLATIILNCALQHSVELVLILISLSLFYCSVLVRLCVCPWPENCLFFKRARSSEVSTMALIELEKVSKTYVAGEVEVPVLKDISMSVQRDEFVALMGASGSGKTTLMNVLGCLDRPSSGLYKFDGQDVSGLSATDRAHLRSQKIGFVFQSFHLLPRASALGNVMMPEVYSPKRPREQEARDRARALLERVGLEAQLDRVPAQLSGGEQQRVAIARALVNRPLLLLADEPTGNLDSHTSAELLRLFQELNADDLTILLVTHDPEIAKHAQRIVHIRDGQLQPEDRPTGRATAYGARRPKQRQPVQAP
jgi:ABC-type lipoprotein export system ATPase subunit